MNIRNEIKAYIVREGFTIGLGRFALTRLGITTIPPRSSTQRTSLSLS